MVINLHNQVNAWIQSVIQSRKNVAQTIHKVIYEKG